MQSSPNEITVFIIIATIMILALVVFIILILFLYQRKQVAFLQSLESLKLDHEKNLLKTQLEIQEQTFQNISREIHDNIGLSLTLAKLNLNRLEFEKTERSKELIISSVDLISKSINDLSDISKCLNSEAISQQGLLNALQLEIERLKKLNRFKVDFQVSGNPVYFDSQKELVLFRIAQEALNNIIKHADAQNIFMKVCFDLTEIRLSIKDNGKGFWYTQNKKNFQENMKAGLANMQIRSSLINGSMEIESEIGKGTTITVTAPLDTIQN
jgi:two-component system NarL family sensor kinase